MSTKGMHWPIVIVLAFAVCAFVYWVEQPPPPTGTELTPAPVQNQTNTHSEEDWGAHSAEVHRFDVNFSK
jgi:hypothetical protein